MGVDFVSFGYATAVTLGGVVGYVKAGEYCLIRIVHMLSLSLSLVMHTGLFIFVIRLQTRANSSTSMISG